MSVKEVWIWPSSEPTSGPCNKHPYENQPFGAYLLVPGGWVSLSHLLPKLQNPEANRKVKLCCVS